VAPKAGTGVPIVPMTLDRPAWRDALLAGLEAGLGRDGVAARQVLDVEVTVTAVETHGGEVIAPVMFATPRPGRSSGPSRPVGSRRPSRGVPSS